MLSYIVFAYYIPKGPYFKDIMRKEKKCINATVTFKLYIKGIAYIDSFLRNAIKIPILMTNVRNANKKGNTTFWWEEY